MTAFFDAYNRHDVNAVLATMADRFTYLDCDYAHHRYIEFTDKETFASWLALLFRGHDHITIDLAQMRWYENNQVVGTLFSRQSDSLTPLVDAGIASAQDESKWRLSLSTGLIEFGGLRGPCLAGKTPPGAKPRKEGSLVTRFFAAYDRHDVAAVLRVLSAAGARASTDVIYTDCDYTDGSTHVLRGKLAVKNWLAGRFAADDRFTVGKVLTNSDFSWRSSGPTAVKVLATRTIADMAHGAPLQREVTLLIVPDSSVKHITVWESWGACAAS